MTRYRLVIFEYVVGFRLTRDPGAVDLLHGLNVFAETALHHCVYRGIVY